MKSDTWWYVAGGVATVVVIVIIFSPQIIAMTTITPEKCYERYHSQIGQMFPGFGLMSESQVDLLHDYADSNCNYLHYYPSYLDKSTNLVYRNTYGMMDNGHLLIFAKTTPPAPDRERMQQIQQIGMQKGIDQLQDLIKLCAQIGC